MKTKKALWLVLLGLSMTVLSGNALAGGDSSPQQGGGEVLLVRMDGNPLTELKALAGGFSFPIAWNGAGTTLASIPGPIEDYLIDNKEIGVPLRDSNAGLSRQMRMRLRVGVGGDHLDRSRSYAHLFPAWEMHLQLHSDFTFGSIRDRLTPPAWERALSGSTARPDPGTTRTRKRGE